MGLSRRAVAAFGTSLLLLAAADAPPPPGADEGAPAPAPGAEPAAPAPAGGGAPAAEAPPPTLPVREYGKGFTDVIKKSVDFPADYNYFAQVVKWLGNDDERYRAFAARQLQYFGSTEAVPPLLDAVDDRAEAVSRNAGLSLTELAGKDEIPALVSLLFHRSQDVRNRAQEKLTELIYKYYGPQDLPERRDPALAVPEEQVGLRERWHDWLSQNARTVELKEPPLPPPPGEPPPKPFGDPLRTPAETLREMKEGKAEPATAGYLEAYGIELKDVLGTLAGGTTDQKIAVVRHVGAIFEREGISFEKLFEIWEPLSWHDRKRLEPRFQLWEDESREDDPPARRNVEYERVRESLWRLGDDFFSALDGEDEVKIAALKVFPRIPWEPMPRPRVRGGKPQVRYLHGGAVEYLARPPRTRDDVVEAIRKLLDDPALSWRMRGYAAWTLGRMRSPKAVDIVIPMLRDEHSFVRDEAFRGLLELTRGLLGFYGTFGYHWYDHQSRRDAAVERWNRWWKDYQAVETRIQELLSDLGRDWKTADAAQAELQAIGPRSLPELRKAARSLNAEIARRAARAIRNIEEAEARPLEAPGHGPGPDERTATQQGPFEPGERRPTP